MRHIILLVVTLLTTLALQAQPQQPPHGVGGAPQSRPPMGMNNQMPPPMGGGPAQQISGSLLEIYLTFIGQHLKLSSKKSKQFEALYTEYHNEISSISKKTSEISDSLTDQEFEDCILESFDITDYSTFIKRKYYPLFKEILTPRQIYKMYDIERELLWRISIESQNRARQTGTTTNL